MPKPHKLPTAPIPRLHHSSPQIREHLIRGEPCVITDCPLINKLVDLWTFDHLATTTFDGSERLQVHYAPAASSGATPFARIYGDGLGAGGVCGMTFARFAAAAAAQRESAYRHYLAAPLLHAGTPEQKRAARDNDDLGLDDEDNDDHNASLSSPTGLRDLVVSVLKGTIEDELMGLIDWDYLGRVQSTAKDGSPFDLCQMWAGMSDGGATPMHFDALSNLLAQIRGRKRVLLFPPSQSFRLYPFPVGHPRDNYAMVLDPNAADNATTFPAFHGARALEATLSPGDVLWLPKYYWHYVTQLGEHEENLSLNFWGGRKGVGDFKKEVWEAAKRPPSEEAVMEAARMSASHHRRAHARALVMEERAAAAKAAEELVVVDDDDEEEDDDTLLGADEALGILSYLSSRHMEGSTTALLGEEAVGPFLEALAKGDDAMWSDEEPPGAWGDRGVRHAKRVRSELISLLGREDEDDGGGDWVSIGTRRCNALLRVMTRHGRLLPGRLSPKVHGKVVNSENGDLNNEEEYVRTVGSKIFLSDAEKYLVLGYLEGESGTEAEKMVRAVHPDGRVAYYEGEKGAERVVRIEWPEPDARVEFYEGESRRERMVRVELPDGKVGYFEGERNEERVVKVEWPDGRVEEF